MAVQILHLFGVKKLEKVLPQGTLALPEELQQLAAGILLSRFVFSYRGVSRVMPIRWTAAINIYMYCGHRSVIAYTRI